MPGWRMLVVEDDRVTRNALQRLFERRGWDVLVAATVAEGLAQLDPPPDCLILDLMLPDGDGAEVLRTVRAQGLPTKVAVCTGTGDADRLAEVASMNPEALLRKPVALADVVLACGCKGPNGVRPQSPG